MKQLRFNPGDEVRIKGDKGRYRYVKHNIVRSIETGQCMGVEPDCIRRKRASFLSLLRYIWS